MSLVPSVVEKAMQLARAGSAAALALAIGTAPDAAAAIGAYAVTTASAERLALVVGGIDGAQVRSDGSNLSVVVQKGTQDGLAIAGRAGGSGEYLGTLVPPTLTASRTYTLPDASVILAGSASALTSGRIPVAAAGGLLSDSANSPTLSGANLTLASGGTFSLSGNITQTGSTTFSTGTGNVSLNGNVTCSGDATFQNPVYFGRVGTGSGGAFRLLNDSGGNQWYIGIAGSAASKDYIMYDYTSTVERLRVTQSTGNFGWVGPASFSGALSLSGTTASTSTTTGNLINAGGLGNGGAGYFGDGLWSIKSTAADAYLYCRNTTATNGAFVHLQAGNGTTSVRYCGVTLRTSETTPQQWNFGLYGSKDFFIRDETAGVTAISMATGGGVTCGHTLDVTQAIKVRGTNLPGTGAGMELGYNSGSGEAAFTSFDRTAVAYKDIGIYALNYRVKISGTTTLSVAASAVTLASGTTLQLGNAAVAATPTPTHTITIKDSTGTTYRVPCVV